jgi:Reverse transcriptase (RNA-dependent DNA polymerase)
VQLRTQAVVDLREQNKNTHHMTSLLPDMGGMSRVSSKPFRSALDLRSMYEQIRIVLEHVEQSIVVTTPDDNIVSQIIQIGDCNAPATYQVLMDHLFSSYISRFMDSVYLDDIVIYSESLDEHLSHVKIVLDILQKEKLYLSKEKLRFLADKLRILGRIIDSQGIRMDPDKRVDTVVKWKTPVNRDLLREFIGYVEYLADDVPGVRLPLGILSAITSGDAVPFRWGYTEWQRAFGDVKQPIQAARDHRSRPLNYSLNADPVWMVTDGGDTGIPGAFSQGTDCEKADIAAFI